MTAGAMTEQVTLQRVVRSADGAGGQTEAWADMACDTCVWAEVRAKAGTESMVEGRTSASFVVLFTIYARSDVDETCRILWNGVAYNIRGIRRETGRAQRLVIEAERGVAQ